MKYFTLILVLILFSCGKKEDVLLPKSNITIVKEVQDLSPIYIFFKIEGKDTIKTSQSSDSSNKKSSDMEREWSRSKWRTPHISPT